MSDERDPILDACLEEVLGGTTPPDLTPRIMQAWSMLPPALPPDGPAAPPVQGNGSSRPPGAGPEQHELAAASASPHPVQVATTARSAAKRRASSRRTRRWWTTAAAIAGLALAAIGIRFAWQADAGPGIAPPNQLTQGSTTPSVDQQQPAPSPSVPPSGNDLVERLDVSDRPTRSPEVITPDFAPRPPFGGEPVPGPLESLVDTQPVGPPLEGKAVVAAIDAAIRKGWQDHEITPAPAAGDEEFAVRLYERLLGRQPTAKELEPFLVSRNKDKRASLVDELLTREENVIEFARHWAGLWADGLLGREKTVAANQASREGLEQYLRRAIQQARPWDQVSADLITATGAGRIGAEQYNGAANFLLAHYDLQATRATSQVARAFLGQRVQCAQCHDHPDDPALAQERFWELNTFLRQLDVRRSEGPGDAPLLTSRDFLGDGGGDGANAEVFYETPSGAIKVAYPNLPGVDGLPRSGVLDEFDRRAGLARYITSRRDFRRAIVNRAWAGVFGYGFSSPIDDLGPHNPPSHPELLNTLADQFAAHDYDLRTLVRWIVSSESFQLGSGAANALADAPERGGAAWFSRNYPAATAGPSARESLLAMAQAVSEGKTELGIGTTANVKPAFPAPGRLSPGDKVKPPLTIASPTAGQPGNLIPAQVQRILAGTMDAEQKLDHLFLISLQRSPTRRERALVRQIAGNTDILDRDALLRVWWALDRIDVW